MKIIRSAVGSLPSLGIIEELEKNKVEVIGIDSNPLSFGLYKLKKAYVVPMGSAPGFLEAIFKIIEKEKPDAILSGPEEELLVLSKNKEELKKRGVLLLCPDYDCIEICTDKKKTYKKFKEIGIPIPEEYTLENVKFPCIIKPAKGRGSLDVYIAKNHEELKLYYEKIKEPIIQEFIKGEEYSIDILSSINGETLSVVPRIRLGVESGISIKGKTVYNKEIIDFCKKISKEFKLFGPSCVQCIRGNNGIKFIEINNRFGGGSILSIKADTSIIPNLIRLIKNEKTISSDSFNQGLIMLRNYSEIFINKGN
jgi:carbamoyl-phosphate synthase large subunit